MATIIFYEKPVHSCINPAAPAIKKSTIIPEQLSEDDILKRMIEQPILIKRPLLEIAGVGFCGFDEQIVGKIIAPEQTGEDLESCHMKNQTICAHLPLHKAQT